MQKQSSAVTPLVKKGDRVVWIGSSSTEIGVYCDAAEFLLRTRHPELQLTFDRVGKGGWRFEDAMPFLAEWLEQTRPTVVFTNFGVNDARAGEAGIPAFRQVMCRFMKQVQEYGSRVVAMTNQAADVRASGPQEAENRRRYAEEIRLCAREQGWGIADLFTPLDKLQREAQQDDPAYSINIDEVHLTPAAYKAWAFFLYQGMNLPQAVSSAVLNADGTVAQTEGCTIADVKSDANGISFARTDTVLPILPPAPLPPYRHVPMEALSLYLLQVNALPAGEYAITCDGKLVGQADAAALAAGVNLNTLLLRGGNPAPWEDQAQAIWEGKTVNGVTRAFSVQRAPGGK